VQLESVGRTDREDRQQAVAYGHIASEVVSKSYTEK
jgi:hypothetical protein